MTRWTRGAHASRVRPCGHRRRSGRLVVTGLLCAVVAGLFAPVAVADVPGACREVTFAVPATDGTGLPSQMAGRLCTPRGGATGTVQVLLHGITYDRSYWDPPGFGANSYVAHALGAGTATLAVDRIGYGASTRPPSATVTLDGQVRQVHQVITAIRAGVLGGPVHHVVTVGHSYGSVIAWAEARYGDVDAIVATGAAHGFSALGLTPVASGLVWPATADPQLRDRVGGDAGYLTTRPGSRRALFHGPHDDPALVALDERLKDTYSGVEVATGAPVVQTPTPGVRVPVLTVLGSRDRVFCGAATTDCSDAGSVLAHERPFLPESPRVDAVVVDGAGHSVADAPDAGAWFDRTQRWIDDVVA